MSREEKIQQWQKRLEDNFSHNDVVGGRFLADAMDTEKAVGAEFVSTYHGHRVLTDSFLEFLGETLNITVHLANEKGWPPDLPHYPICAMLFLTMFRTARASEVLSVHGYPLQGYAVLRSLKDQAWVVCAAANGMATFTELMGWEGMSKEQRESNEDSQYRAVLNRQKIEREVRAKIIGDQSGLKDETKLELLRWERMFNWEAHRALITLFSETGRLAKPDARFTLGPTSSELNDAMFINRANEIEWMILRLLPFLQRSDAPFGKEWSDRWQIMDESFRHMIDGLGNIGKKIAPAFIELIETKFKFNPSTCYAETAARAT